MSQLSIYDSPAIDRLRAELKFDPRRLRAVRTAFFKKSRSVDESLSELPADVQFTYNVTEGFLTVLDGPIGSPMF